MKPISIVFLKNEAKDTRFGIIRHSSLRMFFNGTLCEVQITDNADWWTGDGVTGQAKYQIWDTHSCIDSEGTGMKGVKRINAEVLIIITEMGNYSVRPIYDKDTKIYGVNNFKGLYMEPFEIKNTILMVGDIDYDNL